MSFRRAGNPLAFGGRVPAVVGGLIVATVVVSLAGAVAEQMGFPLRSLLVLRPSAVWGGEVWRLVTWILVEESPLNLLFGGLVLFWFGRDLVDAWGERRFLLTYFGVPAAAAVLASLLALAWPQLDVHGYAGFWVALDALVIAWGLNHPFRQILLFFAVPVSGQALVWVTLGGTLLFALFTGVGAFVPHL
ncbi:MAG: Rhomboid family protein, partial [Anaeromyxobacteraceae bacterium]|nr:Rhomboid family protein [Anaeromyxobacteraceae bacterium]